MCVCFSLFIKYFKRGFLLACRFVCVTCKISIQDRFLLVLVREGFVEVCLLSLSLFVLYRVYMTACEEEYDDQLTLNSLTTLFSLFYVNMMYLQDFFCLLC